MKNLQWIELTPKSMLILILLFFVNVSFGQNTYRYLKINVTDASSMHLQEVEFIAGTIVYPDIDMTSNSTGNYTAYSIPEGNAAYRAFDGTIDKVYIGNNVPYEIILDMGQGNEINPTSVRIQKASWSTMNAFTIEGSNDETNWTTLLTVQNPADWSDFKEFEIQTINYYSLNITSANGSVQKSPDQSSYEEGTSVTLTATPADGYQFESWTGDISDTANPVDVTIDADKNITANFIEIPTAYQYWRLTVNSAIGTGDPIFRNVDLMEGTTAYNLVGYNNFTTNPTVEKDFGVQINPEAIAVATPYGSHKYPDSFTVEASNDEVVWTSIHNESGLTEADYNGDNAVAIFSFYGSTPPATTYSLSVTADNGTVYPSSGTYNDGTIVSLTATPDSGYQFDSWSGDATGTSNPVDVTMNANKNITANFVSISSEGLGYRKTSLNLRSLSDWLVPIFADKFEYSASRGWDNLDGTDASLDADGWPVGDAMIVFWHSWDFARSGRYTLYFEGQADVSLEWAAVNIVSSSYDAATNESKVEFDYPSGSTALRGIFQNTNGGVKNVKLMMPKYDGATESNPKDQVIDNYMKPVFEDFYCIRHMNTLQANQNPQETWSDRKTPENCKALINNSYTGNMVSPGAAWERIIQLSNETQTNPWICIPHKVDNEYIRKVALMFKYGSDGTEPYTSPQANPVYPPLDSNLNLYVEFSNELWNTVWPAFSQTKWLYDWAQTVGSSHPINYYEDNTGWDAFKKATAYKAAEMSKIFREVFGDSEMMTRIRPLYCWQISTDPGGLPSNNGLPGLVWADKYYEEVEGHPINYYFYGGGPAAYRDGGDVATVEELFESDDLHEETWKNRFRGNQRMASAFGMKLIPYEGGISFGDALGGHNSVHPLGEEAFNSPLITDEIYETERVQDELGAEFHSHFVIEQDYRWTFIDPVTKSLDTYKFNALREQNQVQKLAPTIGTAVPATIEGKNFSAVETAWKMGRIAETGSYKLGSKHEWVSYIIRSTQAGTYQVNVDYTTGGNTSFKLYANGDLLTSENISGSGVTQNYTFYLPANKVVAIRVKNTGDNSLTVNNISITSSLKSASAEMDTEITQLEEVLIYPNPVTSGFTVQTNVEMTRVAITDMRGLTCYNQCVNSKMVYINTESLKSGIYIVSVETENGIAHHRISVR